MNAANEHVFSHGMEDTRTTFEAWNAQPWEVLRAWLGVRPAAGPAPAAGGRGGGRRPPPALPQSHMPGIPEPPDPGGLLPILWRSSRALALHGPACVAGFIAGASM